MDEKMFLKDGEYTLFRGKPLVRAENMMCYGDMEKDTYVMLLMIVSTKKTKLLDGTECDVPDKVMGQIYATDTKMEASKRMIKMFPANTLFEALDFGLEYLERKNKKAGA